MSNWLPDSVDGGMAAIVVIVLIGLIVLAIRVGPGLRKVGHVVDDLMGEPARPGVARRPGVMEQLATLIAEQVATREQLTTDDGRPLKLAVADLAADVARNTAHIDTLTQVIGVTVTKASEERVEGHKAAAAAWHAVEAVAEHREATS